MGREPVNRNNNPYSNELSLEEARRAGDKFREFFIDVCENPGLPKRGRMRRRGGSSDWFQASANLPSGEHEGVSIDFVVEASDLDGDFNALVIFRDSEDKGVVYSLEGKYKSGYNVVCREFLEVEIGEDGCRKIVQGKDGVIVGIGEVDWLVKYTQDRLEEK